MSTFSFIIIFGAFIAGFSFFLSEFFGNFGGLKLQDILNIVIVYTSFFLTHLKSHDSNIKTRYKGTRLVLKLFIFPFNTCEIS